MTGPAAPDLAALVSARLCHDLISPMGAIGNGLELMQMAAEDEPSPELTLVADSLATALAKLRYYRLAFGPADAEARISLDEAEALTGDMFTGRFTVSWSRAGHDMPRPTARIVCLTLLCLEKSLPMGGTVQIAPEGERIALEVSGRRIAAPAELWRHATTGAPVEALRSDGVQFALLHRAVVEAGATVRATIGEDTIAVALAVPNFMPA